MNYPLLFTVIQLAAVVFLHMQNAHNWHDFFSITSIGEMGLMATTALTGVLTKFEGEQRDHVDPARFSKLPMVLLAVVLGAATFGCAKQYAIAVAADDGLATVVFGADDIWAGQCYAKDNPAPWCHIVEPYLTQALVDVRAATVALKATPQDRPTIPVGLANIVVDLTQLKAIVAPFRDVGGPVSQFADKVTQGLQIGQDALTKYLGGKP